MSTFCQQVHKLINYVQPGDFAGVWTQISVDFSSAAEVLESLQEAAAGDKEAACEEPWEENSSRCSPVKKSVQW